MNTIGNFSYVQLETRHHRSGQIHCNIIVYVSERRFWADAISTMAPEFDYDPCNVVITRKNAIHKSLC
jgi:hypothetical protein